MAVRPVLRDAALDRRLAEKGFVVIPRAARRAVPSLRRAHRRLVGTAPPGFHSTPYSSDATHKSAVNQAILAALLPAVDDVMTGHRALLASFISKGRGDGGTMPPHMDWTFVDEPGSSSLNFWVPLVDVAHRNGAMSVLPYSHRVPFTIRGSGTDNPFAEIEDDVSEQMVELPMRAGDVLIHDHRLLHSSPPNLARSTRVVAAIALVAEGATACHYRQERPGLLSHYVLDDSFFTDHTYGDESMPASAHLVGQVEFRNPIFGAHDLLAGRGS